MPIPLAALLTWEENGFDKSKHKAACEEAAVGANSGGAGRYGTPNADCRADVDCRVPDLAYDEVGWHLHQDWSVR